MEQNGITTMDENLHLELTDNYVVRFIKRLHNRLFTIAFKALYDNLKKSTDKNS